MFKFRTFNDEILVGELIRTHPDNDNYGYFNMPDGSHECGIILWDATRDMNQ